MCAVSGVQEMVYRRLLTAAGHSSIHTCWSLKCMLLWAVCIGLHSVESLILRRGRWNPFAILCDARRLTGEI